MDPGTRFGKTDKGRQEMARRSGALSPVERRLLILIDGTRSFNDLGSFVRVGEPICSAILRCRHPQELRALLRGIEVFIGQRLDTETTRAFARHFGNLLL